MLLRWSCALSNSAGSCPVGWRISISRANRGVFAAFGLMVEATREGVSITVVVDPGIYYHCTNIGIFYR